MIPSYATHYHLADREPFLNLSDLMPDELEVVLRGLNDSRAESGLKRVFGTQYMEYRRRTETKLKNLYIESGGQPERESPHYFVLGSSVWFKGLANVMREVRLPLSKFPPSATSFTLSDSFTAMALGPEYDVPYESKPHHEKVFKLDELSAVIDRYGMPAEQSPRDYDNYHKRPFEQYVEMQLWSDNLIQSLKE